MGSEISKIVNDPVFGHLSFNRDVCCWERKVSWNNKLLNVSFSAENPSELQSPLETGKEIFKDLSSFNLLATKAAADNLLALRNDCWLEEHDDETSSEEFQSRMTLLSIAIEQDGSYSFEYNDGDLFWGHTISVYGNIEDGFTDAEIGG